MLAGCSILPSLVPGPIDAADPRFEACGGTASGANPIAAFELDHAGAWSEHLPGESPPSEVDETRAFAVVFPGGYRGVLLGVGDPALPSPGHADVCVWNGNRHSAEVFLAGTLPDGPRLVYANVDISGLRP